MLTILALIVVATLVGLWFWNPGDLQARIWAIAGNSKTIAVAYAAELLAALDEFKMIDISSLLGAERAGRAVAIMGLIMFGLRLVTRGAASFKPQ